MLQSRNMIIFAVDAGATSTKALLTDVPGTDSYVFSGPPFNLRQQERDRFRRILTNLFSELQRESDSLGLVPDAVIVGAAGAGDEDDRQTLVDVINRRWPNAKIRVHHDAYIAQYGAFSGGPGVIITSGTGSIVYGRNDKNEELRIGGWGWLLGDEGSGWWIGREALRASLSQFEGGRETSLSEIVFEHFRIKEPYELFNVVYKSKFDRAKVSALSEQVLEHAKAGDTVSIEILKSAGVEMGKQAATCARRLGIPAEKLEVALMGGVGENAYDYVKPGVMISLEEYKNSDANKSIKRVKHVTNNIVNAYKDNNPVQMPQFPPKSISIDDPDGPNVIRPHLNALNGAAQWARDILLRSKFA